MRGKLEGFWAIGGGVTTCGCYCARFVHVEMMALHPLDATETDDRIIHATVKMVLFKLV